MANERLLVMLDMVQDLLVRIRAEVSTDETGMFASIGTARLRPHLTEEAASQLNLDGDADAAYIADLTAAGKPPEAANQVVATETPTFVPRKDLNVPFPGGGRAPAGRPWSTNTDEETNP